MALLEELLVGIGLDTDGLTGGAQGAADEVERSLGGIQAAAAGVAVGGMFAMGLANAMDATAANTKLTNQLGLTEQEAARAGDVAGTVFGEGFGGSIGEVNNALGAVASNIGGMGEATDAELQQMTKAALALADTFEFDVAESTAAVGALIKTGLAKDGTQALDLLTATAQKLPPALREELPVLTKEYGEFFDQLGFTGPDMMGMLAEAAKNPLFEIDKVGDAVKELSLRLADTDAAKEPLKELGLDVKEIQGLVNEGKGTQAFDQIVTALKDVDDQTERTRLQAALFGGPGEDMGNTLLQLSAGGAAAATGLNDAAGASKGITDSMAASPAQQFDSIMRTLANTLGTFLAPALETVSTFMRDNPGLIQILVPVVLALALAIGVASIAQWAWNTALWAFPGTWIIAGIIALIAVIVLIVVYWDEIKAATGRAWDWIVSKLSGAWSWISGKVGSVWDWIVSKISSAWAWITSKVNTGVGMVMGYIQQLAAIPGKVSNWFGQVITWISRLPGRIAAVASGMWDAIPRAFRAAINQIIGAWNNLSFTIGGGSILGKSIPSLTLSTPNIPYLAEGGLTTGPTLAMIGEGTEQEAVLPLSKLDSMLRGVAGAVRGTGDGGQQRLVLDVTGADEDWKRMFRRMVQEDAGGDVVRFAGGAT
ncbi:phage tail tape measure protein [Streptomyces sp. NPDC001780]